MWFLAPMVSTALSGILHYFFATLFTKDVVVRVFIDAGWWLAAKENSVFLDKLVNTFAKQFNYGYRQDVETMSQGLPQK